MIRPKDEPAPRGKKPETPKDATTPPNAETPAVGEGKGAAHEALESKMRECRQLVEQLQRLAAEYSNYQKRMHRVMEDEHRRAVGDLVLDLLPAIDNFERAMAAAEAKPDPAALLEGVRLVHAQLLAGLKKHGITPVEACGQEFDPEHHEAVAHVPSEEHPEGRIVHEVHKGYRYHDRLLRPSRVAVSKGKPGGAGEEGGGAPADGQTPAGDGDALAEGK
jgi:molecular chaperone GrpE